MHSAAPTYHTPTPATAAPYNVFKRIGMLLLALLITCLATMAIVFQSWPNLPTNQQNINSLGLAGIGLIGLLYLQHRKQGLREVIMGQQFLRPYLYGLGAIVIIYALCAGWMSLFYIPRENFMVHFFDGLAPGQIVLLCATLILFPPVAEELVFRHYLMRLVPLDRGAAWQWAAIIVSTMLFTASHIQYQNSVTGVTLLAVGLVFGISRVLSGGLIVPVLLHASAEVIGLIFNYIQIPG
ncbi:CPBP family intramembrane glutamic endopeptidase [Pseudomonas rubra]|uniref:CPBP family intramembrane metalloprotease n=1 Tax=Pseudomonas rubra TaxID=2942627 RepID=A0ABT5PAK6_9PSED|nr:CPBP family intramembrane glutamic endopeptidase [Pseudomonas rubra]MDD1015216.1 CPBP family intramembrane metalloprotease [Pseudomonas rubra]MDD1037870.1 CPBP family intramembrane metalloprotease [Pseudomonas rubra]MDD1152802.1 CPBP family intramembrane metalloprotease [Pseudomonas rubra]